MKKSKIIHIAVFVIPIYLLMVFSLASPKMSVSLTENRTLKPLPALNVQAFLSGQYMKDIEQYYSDHFAFREQFMRIGRSFESWKGLPGENQAVIVKGGSNNMFYEAGVSLPIDEHLSDSINEGTESLVGELTDEMMSHRSSSAEMQVQNQHETIKQNTMKDPDYESEQAEKYDTVINDDHETGQSDESRKEDVQGEYLLLRNQAMMIYKFREEAANTYLQALDKYQDALGTDVNLFTLIVPTKIEYLQNDRYKSLSDSQYDAMKYLERNLNLDVQWVDIYDVLSEHHEEYIYFRTDHHWTALGAYYGYTKFAESIGDSPTPLHQYSEDRMDGFLGSLYTATMSKELEQDPDTIHLYLPQTPHQYHIFWYDHFPLPRKLIDKSYAAKHNNDYAVFLEGDYPWGRIKTNYPDKLKLAVVKDSYGNAFVPFLIPHYSEIYIIDPRFFKSEIIPFLKKHEIDDVLFLNNISVTSQTGYADLLIKKM